MRNQCLFEKYFKQALNETMTAASVGIGATGTQFSGDTYAPGDTRIPHSMFGGKIIQRSPEIKKKKRRSKKKRRTKKKKR